VPEESGGIGYFGVLRICEFRGVQSLIPFTQKQCEVLRDGSTSLFECRVEETRIFNGGVVQQLFNGQNLKARKILVNGWFVETII